MHYLTGAPGELGDQGEYYGLAWWDQLDDGVAWTTRKRALMVVPVVMFLIFLFESDNTGYDPLLVVVNIFALCLVLIPKLPIYNQMRAPYRDDKGKRHI